MKSRKGKGTPHPKGRRSLVHTSYEEDDSSSQIQHSEPDQVLRTQTKSPLQNLLHIHTQVTQTLQQVSLRPSCKRKLGRLLDTCHVVFFDPVLHKVWRISLLCPLLLSIFHQPQSCVVYEEYAFESVVSCANLSQP
uniref:Uncharacterized protein n=1 Tax=Physcomitrium patens TaxID=3218 RepID=A0A7I3Z2I4_PHYPA